MIKFKREGVELVLRTAARAAGFSSWEARDTDLQDLGCVFANLKADQRMVVIGSLVSDGDPLGGGTLARMATLLNAVDELAVAKLRIEQLESVTNHFTDNVDPETFEAFERCHEVGRTVEPDEIDEDPVESDESYALAEALATEREATHRIVHAAMELIVVYLRERAIVRSHAATQTNDAIHDWLDLQPEGDAKRATYEFIERVRNVRGRGQPLQSGALDPKVFDLPSPRQSLRGASGITAAEFAEGASKFPKPPKLPTFEAATF